jgi:large subunit ribosomal protein L35
MPKQKTHKGTAKVLKVRPGGTVSIGCPGSRHNTGKKSAKHNRTMRAGNTLSSGDARRLKNLINVM